MGVRNNRKLKRLDLLEMSNHERNLLIKEVKEKLRQRISEERMWRSLLETESLTVNGNVVYREDQQLSGFYRRNGV